MLDVIMFRMVSEGFAVYIREVSDGAFLHLLSQKEILAAELVLGMPPHVAIFESETDHDLIGPTLARKPCEDIHRRRQLDCQ